MNEVKFSITTAEAERVVRHLADALNSLKAKPSPAVCPAPIEVRQPIRHVADMLAIRSGVRSQNDRTLADALNALKTKPAPAAGVATVEAQPAGSQNGHALAEAVNSLKAKPAPTSSAAQVEVRQPAPPQNDRVHTVNRVSRPAPKLPAVPRRVPTRPASHPALALPQERVFQRSASSQKVEDAAGSRRKIIEEFSGDHELIERLGLTPDEIQTLRHVCVLGKLTCKQDALFILRQIRESRGPYKPTAAVSPETLMVPYQKIEPAIPDLGEMVKWIRGEALAKLGEWESTRRARSRGWLGRFDFFSSVKMMLNPRRQPSV